MKESMLEELLGLNGAEPFEEGHHISEAVKDAAEELKIEAPKVFRTTGKMPFAGVIPLPGNQRMIFTDIFLEKAGGIEGVTPELKAIIGHELGHLKRGGMLDLAKNMAPLAVAPVVALVAYNYLRNAKQNKVPLEKLEDHINAFEGYQPGQDREPKTEEGVIKKWAKYTAVGLGGLLLGGVVSNRLAQRMEYACDKIGAEVASPEAMKSALQILERESELAMERFRASKTQKELAEGFSGPEMLLMIAKEFTWGAHPSTANRIARLDAMAEQQAAKSGGVVVGAVEHQGVVASIKNALNL